MFKVRTFKFRGNDIPQKAVEDWLNELDKAAAKDDKAVTIHPSHTLVAPDEGYRAEAALMMIVEVR